jgi:hypothetical protein
MSIKVTLEEVLALNPCDHEERIALFGKRKSMSAATALKLGVSFEDILWVAAHIGRKDLCVQFALECAQRVAYLNPDPRVQAALDATANYLADPCSRIAGKAWAAGNAAWAASDAAWAASDASRAARDAAWAASRAAAMAARDASRAAAMAAWAAEAADAARAAEQREQRKICARVFK